jgi:hypothetical protein
MNGGSEAGFLRLNAFDCLYSLLALSLLRRRLRLNAFGIAAPSPFRSRFRLNDGFVPGFLRLYSLLHCSLALFLPLTLSTDLEEAPTERIRHRNVDSLMGIAATAPRSKRLLVYTPTNTVCVFSHGCGELE